MKMHKIGASLGYNEKQVNLSIRIEANKRFSNFSLEDWLDEHLPFQAGDVILDIGCGNGNLFPSYSKKLGDNGVIIGIDQSKELLSEAMKCEKSTPTVLIEWDMNNEFPFVEETFSYVISSFAIYYANDVNSIINCIKTVLKPSGEVFLIGPTDNNAKELYEFNKKIFDFDRDEKVIMRTNRIEKEFYPAMKAIFGSTTIDKIPSKLVSPNKAEFIKYYMATLLYEESIKKSGFRPCEENLFSVDILNLEISKEMIVLRGKKNDQTENSSLYRQ